MSTIRRLRHILIAVAVTQQLLIGWLVLDLDPLQAQVTRYAMQIGRAQQHTTDSGEGNLRGIHFKWNMEPSTDWCTGDDIFYQAELAGVDDDTFPTPALGIAIGKFPWSSDFELVTLCQACWQTDPAVIHGPYEPHGHGYIYLDPVEKEWQWLYDGTVIRTEPLTATGTDRYRTAFFGAKGSVYGSEVGIFKHELLAIFYHGYGYGEPFKPHDARADRIEIFPPPGNPLTYHSTFDSLGPPSGAYASVGVFTEEGESSCP